MSTSRRELLLTIRHLPDLQTEIEQTERDSLTDDQQVYLAHKTPLEMYAFLLQWFVSAAEKAGPRAGAETAVVKKKACLHFSAQSESKLTEMNSEEARRRSPLPILARDGPGPSISQLPWA